MKPGHVQVRVRHADDIRSRVFTYWPLDDLDSLIDQFNLWGTPDDERAVGQFTQEGGEWFFEMVVCGDD